MPMVKAVVVAAGALLWATASVVGVTVAEIGDPLPGDIEAVGFTLKKGARINIDAVGVRSPYSNNLTGYAWMIDSETRQLVWEMRYRRADRVDGSDVLRRQEAVESLPPGTYELYYSVRSPAYWESDGGGILDALSKIFRGDKDCRIRDHDLEECYVRVTSEDLTADDFELFRPRGGFPQALIRHNELGDSEYRTTSFELSRPMKLRLYAVIEYPPSSHSPVDYAWVVNSTTRKKVWHVDKWDLEHAGGGKKNMVHDEQIEFGEGTYTLYVVTDDSHSYDGFNVNPPYDPLNWGVTVLPGDDFDRSAFQVVDAPQPEEAVLAFTRVGDNDFYQQSFALSEATELHVYALGELNLSNMDFVDFGAIQEAGSGRAVWEMTPHNTDHAGGAEKNRMFDGIVTFAAGTYTAFYVTDGSHSYGDWNAAPPIDPRRYGLSLYPTKNTRVDAFRLVTDEELVTDAGILARITRVQDDERRRARFTLADDSWVHVYALGEGKGGRMYDYAYVVDLDSGRDVWEMTWRRTDHAGGADKNRVFDDAIRLPAGNYELVYVSDHSHSFGGWNASPPRDALNWGVTLSLSNR